MADWLARWMGLYSLAIYDIALLEVQDFAAVSGSRADGLPSRRLPLSGPAITTSTQRSRSDVVSEEFASGRIASTPAKVDPFCCKGVLRRWVSHQPLCQYCLNGDTRISRAAARVCLAGERYERLLAGEGRGGRPSLGTRSLPQMSRRFRKIVYVNVEILER